jgi:hypothetical protein
MSPVAPADDDPSTDEHHQSGCLRHPQDDQDPRASGTSGGQLIGKTKFEQRYCSRGFRLTGCSLTIPSKCLDPVLQQRLGIPSATGDQASTS